MFRWALVLVLVLAVSLWIPLGSPAAADVCRYTTEDQIAVTTAVTRLKEQGLMMVTPPRVYSPDQSLSRAQAAVGLFRALGLSESAAPTFADTAGHWAERRIAALKERGIIRGFPAGDFHPEEPITLPHFKLMLARALTPEAGAYDPDQVLRSGGIDPAVPCAGAGPINLVQYILLYDRFVRAPALAGVVLDTSDMEGCPYEGVYAHAEVAGAVPGESLSKAVEAVSGGHPVSLSAYQNGGSVFLQAWVSQEAGEGPLSARHETQAREAVALVRRVLEALGQPAEIGVTIKWGCDVD